MPQARRHGDRFCTHAICGPYDRSTGVSIANWRSIACRNSDRERAWLVHTWLSEQGHLQGLHDCGRLTALVRGDDAVVEVLSTAAATTNAYIVCLVPIRRHQTLVTAPAETHTRNMWRIWTQGEPVRKSLDRQCNRHHTLHPMGYARRPARSCPSRPTAPTSSLRAKDTTCPPLLHARSGPVRDCTSL